MADENKPSGQEEEAPNNGTPPASTPDGSRKPEVTPEEQQRRQEQSERDRQRQQEENGDEDRISFLESREMERARDQHVKDFLSENSDKYPNVKADDPLFKYATSKEDVSDIAAQLQNRFKDMQQEALSSVQTDDSRRLLTDEEIEAEEKRLEEETAKTGKSNFGNFIDTISRRKK